MKANQSYMIDFKKLAVMLLPTMLRKPILGSLCQLLTSPVSNIHVRFLQYRKDILYQLQHNGQMCYLQAALNDKFDTVERRIRIQDADTTEVDVIYWREEQRLVGIPLRSSGEYIVSSRGYSSTNGFDFIVLIPSDISSQKQQIRALTNVFKLAGKRFDIVIN